MYASSAPARGSVPDVSPSIDTVTSDSLADAWLAVMQLLRCCWRWVICIDCIDLAQMSTTNLQSPATNKTSAEGFSDGSLFSVSISLTMSPAYSIWSAVGRRTYIPPLYPDAVEIAESYLQKHCSFITINLHMSADSASNSNFCARAKDSSGVPTYVSDHGRNQHESSNTLYTEW